MQRARTYSPYYTIFSKTYNYSTRSKHKTSIRSLK